MTRLPEAGLDRPPDEPFGLFERWYADAARFEHHDVTAMTLATVDDTGLPNARLVLLKHNDAGGFVFYTNYESAKSRELDANPKAALLFWFPVLRRSVRIRGAVGRIPDAEADRYFATRPRGAQLGAWASDQSAPLDDRRTLEARIAEARARFEGGAVPRPPHWGGWRLAPDTIEFWHEGEARLHDRIAYARAGDAWTMRRLYP